MKNLSILIPILFISIVSFQGCKKKAGCTDIKALNYDEEAKEDDNNCEYDLPPTVEITSPSGEMNDGSTILLGFKAMDDIELSSFALTFERGGLGAIIHENSGNLSGTDDSFSETIAIDPEDPTFFDLSFYGSYTLKVEVTDSDGNKATGAGSFSLEDIVLPVISFVTVTESISFGQQLTSTVLSSDLSGIQQVSIELWTVENGNFVSKFDDAIYSYADGKMERTTVDYLFGFENPLSTGDQYKAKVTVTDETGLMSHAESNTGVVN